MLSPIIRSSVVPAFGSRKSGQVDKWIFCLTTARMGARSRRSDDEATPYAGNHTPAFKAKVALAGIKGDFSLAELAQRFDVHPNQMTQWEGLNFSKARPVFWDVGKSRPCPSRLI